MSRVENGPKLDGMEYRVLRSLGTGAGSTIFLVADSGSGSKYALKVVKRQDAADDIYINQALHEFDVAGRLAHPNVLKIHDCRTRKSWFKVTGVDLLMEYVDGRTLDELEKPDRGQLVLIFIYVASALNHMHRRGIYHGDLKPGNIMLARDGAVKVIDFGTAWIRGQPKDRVQGTPQYMAPEQATERVVDERTDLYNFGATMYRMFTGQYANLGMPHVGNGSGAIGARARPTSPIKLDPSVPGTLNETIMACLEPSPDRRPAGVFEVKHQLVAVAKYMNLKPDDLKGFEEDDDEDEEPQPAQPEPKKGGDTGFWNLLKSEKEIAKAEAKAARAVKDSKPVQYRCTECNHVWQAAAKAAPRCLRCGSDEVVRA
jgi:eukaryotic-like serine/threonine-protein kinase